MEWISVEERLPPKNAEVLVYRPLAHETNDPHFTTDAFVGSNRVSKQGVAHGFDRWCHPTHWMPLPPPPAMPTKDE